MMILKFLIAGLTVAAVTGCMAARVVSNAVPLNFPQLDPGLTRAQVEARLAEAWPPVERVEGGWVYSAHVKYQIRIEWDENGIASRVTHENLER